MPFDADIMPTVPPVVQGVLRPLPLAPLQPWLSLALARTHRRHPDIFRRLGEHADKRFALCPTDLPFAFVLEPRSDTPRITVVRAAPADAEVRISAPFFGLLGLVRGDFDGDALFFSRDLLIEGDMEAALALRNAVDDAQIDLVAETAAGLGPLRGPLLFAAAGLEGVARAVSKSSRERAWN
jgi:O2-independent ubiquinone biosynthesis accessory factor UbiT